MSDNLANLIRDSFAQLRADLADSQQRELFLLDKIQRLEARALLLEARLRHETNARKRNFDLVQRAIDQTVEQAKKRAVIKGSVRRSPVLAIERAIARQGR